MKEKAKHKKIEPLYIAYLTDRILVNQGKPQIYGTQFYLNKKGRLIPRIIKNKKDLNKRRKKIGLQSFAEYKSILKKKHP